MHDMGDRPATDSYLIFAYTSAMYGLQYAAMYDWHTFPFPLLVIQPARLFRPDLPFGSVNGDFILTGVCTLLAFLNHVSNNLPLAWQM
jgi:hypothetical protein